MSSTQPTTFVDLWTELGQRLRLTTSLASTQEQLKRAINVALYDIHIGTDYKFPWCERTADLITKAPYSTGTLSATPGSGTITGSGTAWNTAGTYLTNNVVVGGKFIIDGSEIVYKVNSVSSDTSVGLRQFYVGSAAVSGASYTYFENEYELTSTFIRLVDQQTFSPAGNIKIIPRNEFRRRFPVVKVAGKPQYACIIDNATTLTNLTPIRRVMFYPYPDQVYYLPYTFITSVIATTSGGTGLTSMSSDTDVPTMPLRYREAIVYHALYHWYRDKKDDARSQEAKAEYTDIMQRIINDDEIASHTQTRLVPSVGSYHTAAKKPYSYQGGRRVYDLSDDFDSFRR